jgi:hypothetical protein
MTKELIANMLGACRGCEGHAVVRRETNRLMPHAVPVAMRRLG